MGSNVARKEGVGRLGCGVLDGAEGVVVGVGGFEVNGEVPVVVNDGATEGSGGVEASATEDVIDASDGGS